MNSKHNILANQKWHRSSFSTKMWPWWGFWAHLYPRAFVSKLGPKSFPPYSQQWRYGILLLLLLKEKWWSFVVGEENKLNSSSSSSSSSSIVFDSHVPMQLVFQLSKISSWFNVSNVQQNASSLLDVFNLLLQSLHLLTFTDRQRHIHTNTHRCLLLDVTNIA